MELTQAERSILINQFLMLKLINNENSTSYYSSDDYDNFIDILSNGYEGFYEKFLPYNTVSKDISEEVEDILYMYDRATISYEKLSENDKSTIDKYDITFSGFDGTGEYDHYDIYRFIINGLKNYGDMFRNEDLNSHSPRLDKYRKQLELFEEYKISGDILDLDGLIKVFG